MKQHPNSPDDRIFQQLKAEIASDLQPAPPLSAEWKRAAWLFPIWVLLVCLVLVVFGLRVDSGAMGVYVWLLPSLQLTAAYVTIWVGLRTSIPGLGIPARVLLLVACAAVGVHLVVAAFTHELTDIPVPAGQTLHLAIVCFTLTLVLSILPLLAFVRASRRGVPLRPFATGMLCGLGAGIAAEAAWRLHCPFSNFAHILGSHSPAIIASALIGSLIGFLWARSHR